MTAESAHPLEIRLFGPMEARIEGKRLPPLRSRKGMYALALLALRHDRDVPRSYLAALLWPDSPEEQALASLRRTLTDLRQAMGDYADCLLAPTSRALRLDFNRVWADVVAFDRGVGSSQAEVLEAAVALYCGPLLEGCPEEWVLQEREAREEAYLSALEKLAMLHREVGDFVATEGYLTRVVRIRPWRETAQRARMEMLDAMGDHAGVTMAYRDLRQSLRDALNADPDAETTSLYQRLRAAARRRAATTIGNEALAAPLAALPMAEENLPTAPLHNLRRPLTPLIGRRSEVREIECALSEARLVCLTGMGGVGKTRLVTEIGWNVLTDYPGGVRFADLSVIQENAMVALTVAEAFGIREPTGQSLRDAIIERVGDRQTLLLLDNCEHLVDACAELTEHLLSYCPQLRVLATSRQALGLPGERLYPLAPLPLPPVRSGDTLPVALLLKYDAIRLFVEKACAIRPFEINPGNAADVLRICQELDGIPLAMELAAARTKVFSLSQIAERLNDRYHLLSESNRAVSPRQRTLQALLDWSYDILSPAEQTLLRRLTVFVGGWTLEATEAVCFIADDAVGDNDTLILLGSLVDKSLIFVEDNEGERRYRMLETVRQYGQMRLEAAGETERMATRHRDYFLQLAEAAHPHLNGPETALWGKRLDAERDNLRQALKWSVEREARLRFAYALSSFWHQRGHLSEGRAWLEGSLTVNRGAAPSARYASVLHSAGILAWTQGDFDAAQTHWQEALKMRQTLGDLPGVAYLKNGLALVAQERGDYAAALTLLQESQDFFEETNDARGLLIVLINQGVALCNQGRYAEARVLHQKAFAESERQGDTRGTITALGNLAEVAYAEGDDVTAGELWTQCLRRDQELEYPWGIASSLANLGDVARHLGNLSAARSFYGDSLRISRQLGEKRMMVHALEGMAMAKAADNASPEALQTAARCLSAADRQRHSLRMPLTFPHRDEIEASAARLRQTLGDAVFFAHWEHKASQDFEAAIEAALRT